MKLKGTPLGRLIRGLVDFRSPFSNGSRLSKLSRGKGTQRRSALETLESRQLLAHTPIISEFLASNDNVSVDEDGDSSDWLEVHNPTDETASLDGWYLTDDADELTKWRVPDISLAPLEHRLFFASDKDRSDPSGELHTNFRISAGGEYLALVEPDGTTIAHEYAPEFPPQITDVSYGVGSAVVTATFLPEGAPARYHVPQSGALGSTWREAPFNDAAWNVGDTGVGYESSGNAYAPHLESIVPAGTTSIYVRQTFQVDNAPAVSTLRLGVRYDDGFAAYLNGVRVASANAPANPHWQTVATDFHDDDLAVEFDIFDLGAHVSALVSGENVLALHALNRSSGSSDLLIEAKLTADVSTGPGEEIGYLLTPTPGAANGPVQANIGPTAETVQHSPYQPESNQAVVVTASLADPQGVSGADLEYQVVLPGNYFSLEDAQYQSSWTTVPMSDDGTGADLVAGDGSFTASIPASAQQHRSLIRYRVRATDGDGAESLLPNVAEASPNYAYFVYDGVPEWSGAVRPGATSATTYSSELLQSVPIYHLITHNQDVLDAQFHPGTSRSSGYGGSEYLWEGTLVYDGAVYDHIRYRARGGVWRYAMGKNMWKFAFKNEERFQAYDNYGRPYEELWDNLNFSAIIQQGNYLHRGEQGLFESVGFKLFDLAGTEAPNTHYVHFRVVDDAAESTSSQYDGDFWGLYLAVEQPDERFLREHGIPDSNIFKMENNTGPGGIGGELKHQAAGLPGDYSDLAAFKSTYESGAQSEAWWRENLDLDRYYGYRAIVEGIHHYDIGFGKNYYYLHNSETDQWQVNPWDLDLTWANNMFGNGAEPFRDRVLAINSLELEYRNRLREIRDLLYNSEQAGMLIDEMASFVYTSEGPSLVDADRAMWDYNPILASGNVNPNKAGRGRFYERSSSDDFAGMMQLMKNYVVSRGNYMDQQILTDDHQVPDRPTIQFAGEDSYPLDGLHFSADAYASPIGSSFAAVQWRVAEVTDPSHPSFDASQPRKYEIEANWQSEPLDADGMTVMVDATNMEPGKLYRVRARMQDAAGRWSHWSDPIQFTAGQPEGPLHQFLRVTEINYHPHDAIPAAGEIDDDDNEFEFIELANTSTTQSLELSGVRFVDGIGFEFTASPASTLQPGERIVVVRNTAAFQSRYGTEIRIAGEYTGALSNDGETLQLIDGVGATIQQFTYNDNSLWPGPPDGDGGTLIPIDTQGDYSDPANWQSSQAFGGTPGRGEGSTIGLAGDYNGNGAVEQADLDLVLLNWGQPAGSVPATWINDAPAGLVDQNELDAVLLNWGNIAAVAFAQMGPAAGAALLQENVREEPVEAPHSKKVPAPSKDPSTCVSKPAQDRENPSRKLLSLARHIAHDSFFEKADQLSNSEILFRKWTTSHGKRR